MAVTLLVFLLSACRPTADVGETLPTLMPDMPGPAQVPEPSYLEINGQVQTAEVGSYCWDYTDENGKPIGGACKDSIGISTPIEPLPADKTIKAQFSLPYATPPNRLTFIVFTEGTIHKLDLLPRQEVEIELEPGLYVFYAEAGWDDKGDVTYGFLVEVE